MLGIIASAVPENVEKAFQSRFPQAEEVEWMEGEAGYEAIFLLGDYSKSAIFNENGEWLETNTFLNEDQVPAEIIQALKTLYSGDTYTYNNFILTESNREEPTYQLSVDSEEKSISLVMDAKGNVLESYENNFDGDMMEVDEE